MAVVKAKRKHTKPQLEAETAPQSARIVDSIEAPGKESRNGKGCWD
jgi:hypothetical protein